MAEKEEVEETEVEVKEEDTEGWNEVTVSDEDEASVEVETEPAEAGEEVVEEPEPEPEPDPVPEPPKEPELEGIETKGAEKRIRKLIRQRKERDEEIEKLIQSNTQLKGQLDVKQNEVASSVKQNIEISEKQIDDKIELARAAYLNAFESGEKEQLLQSQEILNQAQFEKHRIMEAKNALVEYEKNQTAADKQKSEQEQTGFKPDPKAMRWASENDWFGKDQIMTYGALEIDKQLKIEGYDPSEDEFYEEVNTRLHKEFPHKFKNVEEEEEDSQPRQQEKTLAPAQVVAGTSRSPSTASNRKVKLSQEDLRLANKWKIPLEVYAAEKLKIDKAEGEYTNVVTDRRGG